MPLPPLWMGLWFPMLALAWLLPNHYYPWATFHTDAWVAVMMAFAGSAVILRLQDSVGWRPLPTLFFLLAMVPCAQFFTGLLPYAGQAWINALFVLGLVLALLIGARWEAATPGRAADALFLAIGVAAIASVGLQLRQWVSVEADWDDMQIWMAEFTPGRPSANLGQPNQLATLLLWGLLAGAWGVVRGKLGGLGAITLALYLLFGLALTQSRMAWIAVMVLVLGAWWWRRMLPRQVPRVATWLLLYFFICVASLQYLSDLLQLGHDVRATTLGGGSTHLRLQAYRMFVDAVLQQPWWGYGWNRLQVAELAVAQDHPSMTAFFLQSHNLFLDLILWNGIPIGGLVAVAISIWFLRRLRLVRNREDVVLVMFLTAVGVHAMVELPLHHAYFLLPTGLVMGMLEQRQGVRVIFRCSRWFVLALLLSCSVVLGLVIRDYLRIDESFRAFRLEVNRVGLLQPGPTPEVVILDDMADFMRNARSPFDPSTLTEEDLRRLYRVTSSFPTPGNLQRYAQGLAFLRGPAETQAWLRKMQKVLPESVAQGFQEGWAVAARDYPAVAAIPWPEATKTP